MKKVVVIGSLNMDLVTTCNVNPKEGETVLGYKFMQISGGKGANQAVAIAKMKTKVFMLGKVGKDGMGDKLLKSLEEDGVDISRVDYGEENTGIANIVVEDSGQNRIIVIPGANYEVDKEYVNKHMDIIENKRILLVDDIFTTGATVNEVSKALKKYGVKEIYVITLLTSSKS